MTLAGEYLGGSIYRDSTSSAIGESTNVLGWIDGVGDQVIVIPEPVTGWFGTAAERGGPFGIMMTLARYFAERHAVSPPPQSLVFVATGGHEIGRLGIKRLIHDRPELINRTYAFVHAGDGAAAFKDVEVDGQIVRLPTADENRYLFISDNPLLQRISVEAMTGNGVALAPASLTAFNFGDQAETNAIGIPTVAVTGAHLWFHTPADTPDKTSAELLDPLVKAYIQIIEELLTTDPQQLRDANVGPTGASNPPTCPGEDLPSEEPFTNGAQPIDNPGGRSGGGASGSGFLMMLGGVIWLRGKSARRLQGDATGSSVRVRLPDRGGSRPQRAFATRGLTGQVDHSPVSR